MDYEQLLKKAQEELPEHTQGGERFVIEKVQGHLEGNKTIIINLKKISKDLGRDANHLLKYLLRELASPGKYVRDRAVFGTKISAGKINKKINKYASEFVFCSECSKPDTKLVEEKEITYLKCLACGSKKPVKKI
jgi:translation initiation factor 2 subunit 2